MSFVNHIDNIVHDEHHDSGLPTLDDAAVVLDGWVVVCKNSVMFPSYVFHFMVVGEKKNV